jgi:hypothetical protein
MVLTMYYFEAGADYQVGKVARLDEWTKIAIGWGSQKEEGETITRSVWAVLSGTASIGTGDLSPVLAGDNSSVWAAGIVGLLQNTVTFSSGRTESRGVGISLSYPAGTEWATVAYVESKIVEALDALIPADIGAPTVEEMNAAIEAIEWGAES